MANHLPFKRNRLRATIFVFCFSIIFVVSAGIHAQQRQQPIPQKHCLWEVKAPSNKVFLLGSLHVLKADAYPLAKTIDRAYGLSQKIVFETDLGAMLDSAMQAKMLALGLYPEGQTLFQDISESTRRSLKKKIIDLGLPVEQFARFRPWFLALTLTTLELQRLGFNPVYGIDMHFYNRARADEKEMGFLEPFEHQLNLLAKMNARDQNAFLSQTLKDLELAAKMADDMVMYWKKGDVDNLYALLFKSFDGFAAIKDRLLIRRNKAWVQKIEKMIGEPKNILVIVGAGHLVGPQGVIALLEQKGYKVKQR